jgi:hypothetical protein
MDFDSGVRSKLPLLSCFHTCNMFANMAREHVRELVTLRVEGFLYSVRNGLHRTRPRNKWRHLCYGYGLMFIIIISPLHSTAGHRPLQFQLARSSATRIQLLPAVLRKSSLHLVLGVLHYVYDAASTPELVYTSGYQFYGWYGQPTATSANTVGYVADLVLCRIT